MLLAVLVGGFEPRSVLVVINGSAVQFAVFIDGLALALRSVLVVPNLLTILLAINKKGLPHT